MCFSPGADLAVGAVVGVVAVDTLRHVPAPRVLPLASLPLFFAVHEVDESFVWLGLDGRMPWSAGHAAAWLFLLMAFALPLLVPLAVATLEPDPGRRLLMVAIAAAGALSFVTMLFTLTRDPIGARIAGHHIEYVTSPPYATVLGVVYVATTCGSLLLASDRRIAVFGVVNLLAVAVLAWLTIGGLTSLWCMWAAIISLGVDAYVRQVKGVRSLRPETSL